MKNKIGALLVILIIGIFLYTILTMESELCQSNNLEECFGKKVEVVGIFSGTKGCMGVIKASDFSGYNSLCTLDNKIIEEPINEPSILLTSFVNKCDKTAKYENKIVKIFGILEKNENVCAVKQSWSGNYFIGEIDSIEIIE